MGHQQPNIKGRSDVWLNKKVNVFLMDFPQTYCIVWGSDFIFHAWSGCVYGVWGGEMVRYRLVN